MNEIHSQIFCSNERMEVYYSFMLNILLLGKIISQEIILLRMTRSGTKIQKIVTVYTQKR